MKLTLFDLDNTLLAGDSDYEWGQFLVDRGVLSRADYEAQERLIPLLLHLPPPTGAGPIWLERFSPYFTDPSFPVRDVRPWDAYRYIYPEGQVDLDKLAYFFTYTMEGVVPAAELEPLRVALTDWQERWNPPHRPLRKSKKPLRSNTRSRPATRWRAWRSSFTTRRTSGRKFTKPIKSRSKTPTISSSA